MRSERGYTLIELMMAVGIIGVIGAMVIPITDSSIRGSRLRGDATVIRNLIGVAKMRASAQFTRARVFADSRQSSGKPTRAGLVRIAGVGQDRERLGE